MDNKQIANMSALGAKLGVPDVVNILTSAMFNNAINGGQLDLSGANLTEGAKRSLLEAAYNAEQRRKIASKTPDHEWNKVGVQAGWDYHPVGGTIGTDDYYYGNVLAHPKNFNTPTFNARNTIGSFYYDIDPLGNVFMNDRYDFTEPEKSSRGFAWDLGSKATSGKNVPVFNNVYLGNINDIKVGK